MRWKRTGLLTIALSATLTLPVAAATGTLGFDDVAADNPHAQAVQWLADNGISNGCAPQLFCPDDPVSRAHMATFLKRLAEAGVVDAATVEGLTAAQLQGQTGPAGPAGVAGPVGPTGAVGPAGAAGASGPVGATGAQGATGQQGPTGLTGLTGETGLTGAQGEKGETGAQGHQGSRGEDGNTILGLPGLPSLQLGKLGDLYLDTTAVRLYGPKTADHGWGVGVALIGKDGKDGLNGQDGLDGKDAATWLTGEGQPSGSVGHEGDLYLDVVHHAYYGPKHDGSWGEPRSIVGAQGIPGQPGAAGATWHHGSGQPEGSSSNDEIGKPGDFYLDTSTHTYYGPKTLEGWGSTGISLIGPKGDPGTAGQDGESGTGFSMLRVESSAHPQAGVQTYVKTQCPTGYVVTGGGFSSSGDVQDRRDVVVLNSFPSSVDTYEVVAEYLGSTAPQDLSVTAYALCAPGTAIPSQTNTDTTTNTNTNTNESTSTPPDHDTSAGGSIPGDGLYGDL